MHFLFTFFEIIIGCSQTALVVAIILKKFRLILILFPNDLKWFRSLLNGFVRFWMVSFDFERFRSISNGFDQIEKIDSHHFSLMKINSHKLWPIISVCRLTESCQKMSKTKNHAKNVNKQWSKSFYFVQIGLCNCNICFCSIKVKTRGLIHSKSITERYR